MDPKRTSLYEAANLVIIKHKRLFPAIYRFKAAANLIIVKNQKQRPKTQKKRQQDFNYKGSGSNSTYSKSLLTHERITQSPNIQEWSNVPNPVVEGWLPVIKWCTRAPLHATLYHTIPSCKEKPNFFLLTFLMSVFWIAVFSYIMVWMVNN